MVGSFVLSSDNPAWGIGTGVQDFLPRTSGEEWHREHTRVVVIGRGRDGGRSGDGRGAATRISHHGHRTGKGSVHVPRRLPNAVGPNRDHGDGKNVAESLRAARLGRP